MQKYSFVLIVLVITAVCAATSAIAEEQNGEIYRVEAVDGSIFIGELISRGDEIIVLLTESIGEVTISREKIKRMTRIDTDRIRHGEYWYRNPQATRYLFAPNATGLKKGKGYFQNTWIFFNNLNYGVTNNFSIGLGTVPMFLFGGATPVWIIPKVSMPVLNDKFHLSAGALLGGVIGSGGGAGGIFYGAGTYGNTNNNITLGLGYGYSDGSISSSPVLNISAMLRVTRTGYLISENYFFPESSFNGIASIGYRWAPENFAVDFALVRPLERIGSLVGVPWLGVTIPFGD